MQTFKIRNIAMIKGRKTERKQKTEAGSKELTLAILPVPKNEKRRR